VDGCTPSNFASSLELSHGSDIALDPLEGMVYWAINTEGGTSKVQRKSVGGGVVEDIFSLLGVPSSHITGIAVDPVARQVYVATPGASTRIRRFAIDSPATASVAVVLFNESGCPCSPQGLALDLANGFLYWADSIGGVRRKALTLASALEELIPGLTSPSALALDVENDRVYFSQTSPNRISYAALSSPGTVLDLVNPLPTQLFWGGLERDPGVGTLGELYILLTGELEIRHCSLDGGCPSPQTLLTSGMQDGRGLVLLDEPATPIPALGGAGALALAVVLLASAVLVLRR
jgi:hypothetical protein